LKLVAVTQKHSDSGSLSERRSEHAFASFPDHVESGFFGAYLRRTQLKNTQVDSHLTHSVNHGSTPGKTD
jgi:hypothetical protein